MKEMTSLPLDDKTLDRLVDGELEGEEYEAAIRSLDQKPGLWRRCALAFLEAQAWQRELGAMRRDAEMSVATEVTARQPRGSNRWSLLLAVAASFLVAFGLGLVIRPFSPAAPAGAVTSVAENGLLPGARSDGTQVPLNKVLPLEPSLRSPSGNVMVMVDGGDGSGSQGVSVPVFDWSPHTEKLLSGKPTSIPAEVRRALVQLGYELRMNRHFIHGETTDGRPALIPVEQVEIVPAGRRAFQ